MSWRIAGTYLESCSCDAPCPCRRINGVPGGRSTHGICEGALCWRIVDGEADGLDLSDLSVVMAIRYSDDEEGSPWSWILYLDERGSAEQHQALEQIWAGRVAGRAARALPVGLEGKQPPRRPPGADRARPHPRRQWFKVRDLVTVRVSGPYEGDETITCVIPGHDRSGEEIVADELNVDDAQLRFEYAGVCGYAATFDYGSG